MSKDNNNLMIDASMPEIHNLDLVKELAEAKIMTAIKTPSLELLAV